MNQRAYRPTYRVLLICLLALVGFAVVFAANPDKQAGKGSLNKTAGTPVVTILNINNFTTFMRADGQGNHQVDDNSGGRFPRSASTCIYEDGHVWGGKAYLDAAYTIPAPNQVIRVGGQTYNQGTKAGWVNGTGATAVANPPGDAGSRIYRIRRDYAKMTDAELRADAATLNLVLESAVTPAQMDAVKQQYAKDWAEWPAGASSPYGNKGAPFIDRNNNGVYDAPPAFSATFTVDSLISGNYDEPGIAGADPNSPADQVIWTVYNDLDRSATLGLYFSEPLGLEGQVTVWGYKRSDALGNLYFKKIKLINKGGVDIGGGTKGSFYIDSMFVSQWSDPDLGDAGDDVAGSDTTLSLGFVYNGNANDAEYRKFSLPPPAVGYDFLQGPIVAGAATDSAVFDLKRRYGKKNLPMTAFVYFSAGSAISDPPLANVAGASYESTRRWWRMLRGLRPDDSGIPERYYPFPPGITPGPFCLTGDPVTRTGFIDGQGPEYSLSPGDRRIVLASGPFRLAPGDTQEVVMGTVAGLGSDRLSSVSVMKFNDKFVQNTYNALFAVPKPPPIPAATFAQLDSRVVFEWASNQSVVAATEKTVYQPGSFYFEGYNVYQLPNASSGLADAKRIATYDLTTDPTVVLDQVFDVASGQILLKPVQYGTNSGITRYFSFDRDYIKDIPRLNNGSDYYVAITAYTVSRANYLPISLESPLQVYKVTPQKPRPGSRLGASFHDTIAVKQVTAAGASPSDGSVIPFIIDPNKLTGHSYEVTFREDTLGNTFWDLTDKTLNTKILANQTNQTGDEEYSIVDGMLLKVLGPPPGVKDWSIPNGTRRWTWADGDGLALEGFNGAIGWTEPAVIFGSIASPTVKAGQLKNVLIKFAPAASATTGPDLVGYPSVFYAGWDTATVTDPNFSYGYRYVRGGTGAPARPEFAPYLPTTTNYGLAGYKKNTVPFSAWNVEVDPPQRLAVGFLENNVPTGLVDGRYWPPPNGAGFTNTSTSGREWFFIFATPYTGATYNPAYNTSILSNGVPIMYTGTVNRRGGANYSAGDEFLIMANHVNTSANTFTFTAPTTTQFNATLAKEDVGKINAFPNPYYAFNPREISRTSRFITFNHLPTKATIRIFNLAGQLVRTLQKDTPSQYFDWDLANDSNFPVASGMYIVHVDMPDLGATKVLKVAIIQEQEVPNNF